MLVYSEVPPMEEEDQVRPPPPPPPRYARVAKQYLLTDSLSKPSPTFDERLHASASLVLPEGSIVIAALSQR